MANEKRNLGVRTDSAFNLFQYTRKKKGFINEFRRLIITIGLFLIMQIIFIAIDGTFLEPNLNKIGNFASNIIAHNFFDKSFFLYDNPLFKIITAIGILHIIYVLGKTIILGLKEKDIKTG